MIGAFLDLAFLVLFIERIPKGEYLVWYKVRNGGDFAKYASDAKKKFRIV